MSTSSTTVPVPESDQPELRSKSRDRPDGTGEESKPVSRGLRLLDLTIFGALLCTIALTAIPYGTVDVWWEAAFESLIFALVGLWVCEGLWRGKWGVSLRGMLLPVGAILAYAVFQTIPIRDQSTGWPTISADPYGTRLVALKFLAIICTGLLLARYTSSRRRLRALLYTILVIAVASAIFGILRETTQHNTQGFGLPQLTPGEGYGQFINRNHFAYLMEMGLGLALGLTVGKGQTRGRLLYLAAALPMLMALVLANSRGGILSLFSQIIFLLLMFGAFSAGKDSTDHDVGFAGLIRAITNKLAVRVLIILCLLGAMVAGIIWVGGNPLTKRLETIQSEVSNEDADTGEGGRRVQIWRASWKIVKDHPITGTGFGGYWLAITEYYDVPGQKRPYRAHNDYLELLIAGGIIGAALGIWFFIAFLKRIRVTLKTRDAFRRAACVGALTGLFGIAVHSIVDFGLHITINALITVALIVIATTDERVEEANNTVPAELYGTRPGRVRRSGSGHTDSSASKRSHP